MFIIIVIKFTFKRTTVNPDKSMAMYNKLQIISVTGKENKIIVTRLSTVNRGQYRGMWCIYCYCTKKNREWPGYCYSYTTIQLLAGDLRFFASSPALLLWYINLPLFASTINIEYLVKNKTGVRCSSFLAQT